MLQHFCYFIVYLRTHAIIHLGNSDTRSATSVTGDNTQEYLVQLFAVSDFKNELFTTIDVKGHNVIRPVYSAISSGVYNSGQPQQK